MVHQRGFSRRRFLRGAAAGGTLGWAQVVGSRALGVGGVPAPSSRITLGFIGTGDHGIGRNLTGFLRQPDAQVLAVCDVDASRRENARKIVEKHYAEAAAKASYQGCASYNDFREIIQRRDIDAVVNSTPDHWHVIPSIQAVRAGKDVICEKPLSLTVAEGRALADAVRKHNRIFQTASENRSMQPFHRICELVRNGRIGKLLRIRVQLPSGYWIKQASQEVCPPPPGFDYQMWLGQAPEAPYCPARCHWNFRWILDYSGGMLTDWGAHLIDIAQWGNDTELTGPVEVSGSGEFPKSGLYNAATKFDIRCKYANGVELQIVSRSPAIRFEGTDGWIGCPSWGAPPEAHPKAILDSKIGDREIHLDTAADEHRNFLDCVKSRKPCYATAEIGHRTITIAHLGNIAMRLGRKLRWDPDKEHFVDDPEADKMLSRPMRPPWTL
ncbi:MAG: Gfo/Idh/MocA family protein [Thermoguttaceae bacterium]